MTKSRSIASLAAACCLVTAAFSQTVTDGPGVTVTMNGATVMHRTGVNYPAAARQRGVQGTLSVEVKLDSTGNVNDARILSGPEELRKAALESVLQWHFSREVAGSTRVIQMAFELPKPGAVQEVMGGAISPVPMAAPPPPGVIRQTQLLTVGGGPQPMQGRITSIRVAGLPEQSNAELLASLPVHEGDEWNADAMQKANQAAKAFDEHLTVQMVTMDRTQSGGMEVGLLIMVPGTQSVVSGIPATPGRIQVGDNVQGAMLVRKVPPVYPASAKAGGVSGIVHMSVIIGKDGTIQDLNVLSGPPLLIQAAVDSVRQWVYKPTLLNGSPVEVKTTIDVNFTLNQ